MNRSVKIWLSAWCLLLPAVVFAAEPQANLERKTTINVTAASPKDVYGSLAKVLGCELDLAPEIQEPLTLRIPNVTVRTALNAISESVDAFWQLKGGKLHIGPLTTRASSGGAERMTRGQVGAVGAGMSRGIRGGVAGGVSGTGVGPGLGSGQGGSGVGSGRGGGIGGVAGGVSGGAVGRVQGGIIGGVNLKARLDRKTPAGFRFDNVLVEDVLSALGKILNMEVRIEGLETGKRVTLDLSNQTVFSALKTIQEQVPGKSLIFVLDAVLDDAGKNKVRVQMRMGKDRK